MKKTTLLAVILLLVALGCIWGAKKVIPIFKHNVQQKTSDAKNLKGTIRLAVDDWIGYYPMRSSRMSKFMRSEGYMVDVQNDGADYPARMKKLQSGELDLAVVTVDSYILNAALVDFPGTIIMIIDESKGGDAMVAYTNVVSSLDSFKETRPFGPSSGFKIAYTASSPSEHLLKAIKSHFNVPALKNLSKEQQVETKDSDEALKLFQSKKVPCAILWEPNVSRALQISGVKKILGTESTSGVIVDILVVNRDFAAKNSDQVTLFLQTYFRILKFYSDNPEDLAKDISAELKLPADSIKEMLDGVAWVNLSDNAQQWFGVSGPGQVAQQRLVDTIESTVSILVESGDFKENPLPDKDPYRIINSSFIQEMYTTGVKNGFAGLDGAVVAGIAADDLTRLFKALTDAQWDKLRSVGSIRVEPIMFQSGLSDLDIPEKEKLDAAVSRLKHYPTFRIVVSGHTSNQGDHDANVALSHDRADAVCRYLQVTYSIDQNRLRSVGYGGDRPLSRQPGESDRAYQYRLPRVELSLVQESY